MSSPTRKKVSGEVSFLQRPMIKVAAKMKNSEKEKRVENKKKPAPVLVDLLGTPKERASFGIDLLAWARVHGRKGLPWQVSDAYAIWVSEIMLQQTQVETVKAYFTRFLSKFPTISALASASEDDVLASWAGLGYYRRAKFLHKAAKQVSANGGTVLPRTVAELMSLPGIGRSTAAAIASIAYAEPVAIMDGNVVRVLARRFGEASDVRLASTQARLWRTAESLVVHAEPGLYTQSIMDLGATVCTPRAPRCEECPFSGCCSAFATGKRESLPYKPKKEKIRRVEAERWIVLTDGRNVALQRNDQKVGVWQSMLVFPELAGAVFENPPRPLKAWSFRHVFSHYDLHVDVEICLISQDVLSYFADQEAWLVVSPHDALDMAVPKPVRDVLNALVDVLGGIDEAIS